jgi:hypothetical protein
LSKRFFFLYFTAAKIAENFFRGLKKKKEARARAIQIFYGRGRYTAKKKIKYKKNFIESV